MTAETIKLPIGGIVLIIEYDKLGRPINGFIESSMHFGSKDKTDIETIERLVLAHAMAEVDIESDSYIEGLESVINQLDY